VIDAPEVAALVEFIKSLQGPAEPSVQLPRVPPDALVPAAPADGGAR
jgi:hypothetical protein